MIAKKGKFLFWCSFNLCKTHLSNFFTLPICFKLFNIVGIITSNLTTNSHVVWDVSASIITFSTSFWSQVAFPRLKSPERNFSNRHCAFISHILAKYVDTSMHCIGSMEFILENNTNFLFLIYGFTKINSKKLNQKIITNQNMLLKEWWCILTIITKNCQSEMLEISILKLNT